MFLRYSQKLRNFAHWEMQVFRIKKKSIVLTNNI